MDLLFKRFIDFLGSQCLQQPPEKMLLAVSGGIDSVVMMHMFWQSGYNCEVAHCNFQLRGEDSDADEYFVHQLAKLYNFPFHTTRFVTGEYAYEQRISIQMAARELRYKWFDELIEKDCCVAVAVAHHANDVAETMLLNLAKGTGLAGMHGIQPVHGNVIRPLLFATKSELEAYAAHHTLSWREDSSNAGVQYKRNLIRHEVIPVLEEINPDLTGALLRHAKLMTGYEALLNNYIVQLEAAMIHQSHHGAIKSISLKLLLNSPAPAVLLYHFLKPYGAGGVLCEEILAKGQAGTEFYSNGFKIVRDREALTIFDPDFFKDEVFVLHEVKEPLDLPFGKLSGNQLSFDVPPVFQNLPDFGDSNTAYIDMSELKFPFVIRKWHNGDSFKPLGMTGRKLLSDFFIDSKFTSAMKEVVFLLVSGGEVVWVIGHRIDDRYKITEATKICLRFSYTPVDNPPYIGSF